MASILSLDVGTKRIGVAKSPLDVRLASPLTTIDTESAVDDTLLELAKQHDVRAVVVGLPRGMSGQETDQTNYSREFAEHVRENLKIPVYLQDEAGTSIKAKEELAQKSGAMSKEDVDSLAATYILQDFLETNQEKLKELQ